VANEHPVEFRSELIRDLSMAVNTHINRTINSSPRAKDMLSRLIEESMDSLHIESLLNLPALIQKLDLDDTLTV